MWVALALSVASAVYNNAVNRWRPFHGAAYVPVNVAFTVTVAVLAAHMLDLSPAELGFRSDISDTALPLALVGLFALGVFSLALSRHGRRIADERVAGMRGKALAWYVLIRIPLGTAVVEEVLFRGVLFAAWSEAGRSTVEAALWASIAFGLWHIQPTVIGVRLNDPRASKDKVRAAVLAAVLLTTIAGLGLTWLRVWTDGLLGPIVLHAGINSVGALAAVIAARRPSDG